MKVFKRLLAIPVGLLSVIFFGFCVAGIVEVWMQRQPLTERTTEAFTHADRILDLTIRGTEDVQAGLENARTNLQAIRDVPPSVHNAGKDPGFFETMLARMLAEQLASKM